MRERNRGPNKVYWLVCFALEFWKKQSLKRLWMYLTSGWSEQFWRARNRFVELFLCQAAKKTLHNTISGLASLIQSPFIFVGCFRGRRRRTGERSFSKSLCLASIM